MTSINPSITATKPAATKHANRPQRPRRMARQPKGNAVETPPQVPRAGDPAADAPITTAIPPSPAPRAGSKSAAVVALLEREQGATLPEMIAATGWLPHTTRAALTGLKKKGHVIERDKRGDVTCYRIVKTA